MSGDRTLSWSVQPHKKSINLGIFKHPGGGGNLAAISSVPASTYEPPPTPQPDVGSAAPRPPSARSEASNAARKLQGLGLILISWWGRCEAEKVATGTYDVSADQGGMYAVVFDNTFSKQTSKAATVVLMTYPTNAPPLTSQSARHLTAGAMATTSSTSLSGRGSPCLSPSFVESTDSLHDGAIRNGMQASVVRQNSAAESHDPGSSTFYMGTLFKRRRKRHQGYARRFFSLDFTTSTLSYYHSRNSSALRGAIPLSLAVIGANKKAREISVDSGTEVWHLRAASANGFAAWKLALEKASRVIPCAGRVTPIKPEGTSLALPGREAEHDLRWGQAETLVGRVAGIRDAVRRLATSTGQPSQSVPPINTGKMENPGESPMDLNSGDYFRSKEKRRRWKGKPSGISRPSGLFRRSPSGPRDDFQTIGTSGKGSSSSQEHPRQGGMHEHCLALLRDLDSVVGDFTELITLSKQATRPGPAQAKARTSLDSLDTAEYYDADDGDARDSRLLDINDSGDEAQEDEIFDNASDSASSIEGDGTEDFGSTPTRHDSYHSVMLPKSGSLAPLPLDPVRRRTTVPPAAALPPSLIGFLRKNVGKDLSTISMPVSANEPISLLQRLSEQLEYASLLDVAATTTGLSGVERLLYVTAFMISSLSNSRVKERSIRKPFNPMLGETFELVREDLGFRLIVEKVTHRPLRMACQADSRHWTYTHAPMPTQKFWGKSAELATDGKVRILLHGTGECFSCTPATSFLRNLIAGEKYVEPVGTMTVVDETTGRTAIVSFKAKGMFSGRSEEVVARVFERDGQELSCGLTGKWTASLSMTENGTETRSIWRVGKLVDDASRRYGFTAFAASLNEITPIESGRLPPTDSRLRLDQRAVELGDLEEAETIKQRLEEGQRARRKKLEDEGREWEPRWFERVPSVSPDSTPLMTDGAFHRHEKVASKVNPPGGDEGEDVWRLKTGDHGYWEDRARGEWTDVVDIFTV